MFEINNVVIYGSEGVCKIISIEKRMFADDETEYYVLVPLCNNNNTNIYVPTNNEKALMKLKLVCSKEEIDDMIKHIGDEKSVWIEDETARREEYGRIIKSGSRLEILNMIKTLYLHRKEMAAAKKKFHSADERLLNIAENMIFQEFAYVLGIECGEVWNYIKNHTA